jgi:predicted transcriptional regulator of viral defense system
MSRAQLIARVRPGLYLVPPQLPLGGVWNPSEALALQTLMKDCQAQYQICGPNAFNRYGYDEQVPARLYVYNNRLSGDRKIGSVAVTLIEVSEQRLGGTESVTMPGQTPLLYSSRVRTLVDAVYDWSRFSSLPRAYRWISGDLASKRVTASELAETTVRYGNQGTIRRMGVLLEREGAPSKALRTLESALRASTGLIPWNPAAPKRGRIERRWGVIVNG